MNARTLQRMAPGLLLLLASSPAAPVRAAFGSTAGAPGRRLILRLLNADTGDAMSHQNVIVEWDADAEESTVYVGGRGQGEMSLLPGGEILTLRPGFKSWGEANRLAYYSCSGPTTEVPVLEALRAGFVAHNDCNGRTVAARPGEVVYWARPLPLWRPDFQ